LAYQGREDLPRPAADDTSWHVQIFTDYIARMLRQKGMHRRYTADKTIAWLSWIAGQLWLRNRSSFAVSAINEAWQPSRGTHLGHDDGDASWGAVIGGTIGAVLGAVGGGGWDSLFTAPWGAVMGMGIGQMVHSAVVRPIARPGVLKDLQQKGLIPEDFDDFLEHCARLIFLRKVGVEAIFIHRLLLDRFALWEAPQLVFDENRFLDALKQYLAELQGIGYAIALVRYAKYRWILMQYFEGGMPEGRTPEGFIRWVDQQRTKDSAWFKKWGSPGLAGVAPTFSAMLPTTD
jgi:hypothetical protein